MRHVLRSSSMLRVCEWRLKLYVLFLLASCIYLLDLKQVSPFGATFAHLRLQVFISHIHIDIVDIIDIICSYHCVCYSIS